MRSTLTLTALLIAASFAFAGCEDKKPAEPEKPAPEAQADTASPKVPEASPEAATDTAAEEEKAAEPSAPEGTALKPDARVLVRLEGSTDAVIDQTHVTSIALDASGDAPRILVSLNDEGTEAFAAATEANINKKMEIVVGDAVISAPVIREKIEGGRLSIDADNAAEMFKTLALEK